MKVQAYWLSVVSIIFMILLPISNHVWYGRGAKEAMLNCPAPIAQAAPAGIGKPQALSRGNENIHFYNSIVHISDEEECKNIGGTWNDVEDIATHAHHTYCGPSAPIAAHPLKLGKRPPPMKYDIISVQLQCDEKGNPLEGQGWGKQPDGSEFTPMYSCVPDKSKLGKRKPAPGPCESGYMLEGPNCVKHFTTPPSSGDACLSTAMVGPNSVTCWHPAPCDIQECSPESTKLCGCAPTPISSGVPTPQVQQP